MCGLFGVYSFDGDELGKLVYYGLFALQHRGQESAGIASTDGQNIKVHKGMGLVNVVFDEKSMRQLSGKISFGHVRYSTTGSSILANAQPILMETKYGEIALGHNGNLINIDGLKKELIGKGHTFSGTTDSEVIVKLIASSDKATLEEAIIDIASKKILGAFSLIIMTKDKLIALKDPYGIRPLCVGKLENAYVLASETCALDIVGAQFMREITNGEMVVIDKDGLRSTTYSRERNALSVFEFIYFARPDSIIMGRSVYEARIAMGKYLAQEHPCPDAELIIGVPDSGIPAAIGFASESKVPFGEGLIKNRYVGRTFIQPSQEIREMGVKVKLNPLRETLRGKKVVIVDDSVVRGTTSRQLIKIVRDAGAREVHMRVSSPPIISPCYYGIDTSTKSELIAANLSIEGIKKYIDADSLGYLSSKSLAKAVSLPRETLCMACLDSKYPIKIPEKLESLKLLFNA